MQNKSFIRSIFRNGPSDLQIRKPAVLLSGNGLNRIVFHFTPALFTMYPFSSFYKFQVHARFCHSCILPYCSSVSAHFLCHYTFCKCQKLSLCKSFSTKLLFSSRFLYIAGKFILFFNCSVFTSSKLYSSFIIPIIESTTLLKCTSFLFSSNKSHNFSRA